MHTNHDFSANEYKNYESITLRGAKYLIPYNSYQHSMVTINKLAIEAGGKNVKLTPEHRDCSCLRK